MHLSLVCCKGRPRGAIQTLASFRSGSVQVPSRVRPSGCRAGARPVPRGGARPIPSLSPSLMIPMFPPEIGLRRTKPDVLATSDLQSQIASFSFTKRQIGNGCCSARRNFPYTKAHQFSYLRHNRQKKKTREYEAAPRHHAKECFCNNFGRDGIWLPPRGSSRRYPRISHPHPPICYRNWLLLGHLLPFFPPPLEQKRKRNPKRQPSYVILVAQHCDPPYRAIGYSYTYRIYVFRVSQGIALYPPLWGVSRNYADVLKAHGGVSQVKAALSAIGCYRGYRSYTVANPSLMAH